MAKKSKISSKLRPNLISKEVYRLVKRTPRGKVATYGQISDQLRINPRVVGWMLYANRDPNVPCHRVVDRNGRIAPNFGFGGADEQRRRLIEEGVKFKDEMHVDLAKDFWRENPKS